MTGPDGPAAEPAGPGLSTVEDKAALPILARRLARGIQRSFVALGQASLSEMILATGRRADVMAIDRYGTVTIVEIKSGVPDFRADRKWPDYTGFCDRFLFAVPSGFPDGILPADCGLMIADAYEAVVVREPAAQRLSAARRKAVTLRFAQLAARRLLQLSDPDSAVYTSGIGD